MTNIALDILKTITCMFVGLSLCSFGQSISFFPLFLFGLIIVAFSPHYFLNKYGDNKKELRSSTISRNTTLSHFGKENCPATGISVRSS